MGVQCDGRGLPRESAPELLSPRHPSKPLQSSHRPTFIISRLSYQLPTHTILRKHPDALRWRFRLRPDCLTTREVGGTGPTAGSHLYELLPRASVLYVSRGLLCYIPTHVLPLSGSRIEYLITG